MTKTVIPDIGKYPLLANNEALSTILESIETAGTIISTGTKTLEETIQCIQAGCTHQWKEVTRYDKHVCSASKRGGHVSYGSTVLESRTCTECGAKEERPKGSSCEICDICWSPMKYHSQIPGQGEHTSVYECTNENCSHASWHT